MMRRALKALILALLLGAFAGTANSQAPNVPALVAAVSPSVVRILVVIQKDGRSIPTVLGSGFVVGPDGLVATAAHVLEGIPMGALLVVPADIHTFTPESAKATLVSADQRNDVAILRSEASRTRKPLLLEGTANVLVGEDALVFGFPLGNPVLTVAKGMVAAKTASPTSQTQLIKLDASVNKGNSGGPVVRISTGRVIGLASLKEGSLQERLQKLLREKPTASLSIGGNDPIELIKFVVQDMETNLQLGLGYAVASEHLSSLLKGK
jgi:S1-C subfamily serine protease